MCSRSRISDFLESQRRSRSQTYVLGIRSGRSWVIPQSLFRIRLRIQSFRPLCGAFEISDGNHTLLVPIRRIQIGQSWTLVTSETLIDFTIQGICNSGYQTTFPNCNSSDDDDFEVGTSNSIWVLVSIQIYSRNSFRDRRRLRDLLSDRCDCRTCW